jgi:hypothetical protein
MRFLIVPLLLALAAFGLPAPSTLIIETGSASTLGVSGVATDDVTTRMPGNNAILWGLHLDEKSDAPCDLDLFWWRKDTSTRTQGLYKTRFQLCGERNSSNGFVGVGWPPGAPLVTDSNGIPTGDPHRVAGSSTYLAAHGLRACLNRRGDRVKGVRLFGSTVNQDGAGEARRDVGLKRDFERTNCNEWKVARRCPEGEVMVGVDIHHTDTEIHGLAPKCASVTVREVMIARPD